MRRLTPYYAWFLAPMGRKRLKLSSEAGEPSKPIALLVCRAFIPGRNLGLPRQCGTQRLRQLHRAIEVDPNYWFSSLFF